MTTLTGLTLLLIVFGGLLMLLSFAKCRVTIREARGLLSSDSTGINRLYSLHQVLMCSFIAGYLFVMLTIIFDIAIIGTFFTGVIFFLGSVFVFIGIKLQSNMLDSMRLRHDKTVRKNEQLLQTENVTIFALAYQAELRDGETGKHLERTSRYAEILALQLSRNEKYKSYMTEGYVQDISKSAPLHDIGKVGIPDSILQKPGKLTEEEFKTIKKHCEYGANILKAAEKKLDFRSFLTIAVSLVMSHHERWDGKGYPHGLKGDDIPLSARIMALADVYDALRSKRCYKDSMSHEEACRIIASERAKQFDPDITDAFLNAEKEFSQTSERLAG